jgi:hypothetical protein
LAPWEEEQKVHPLTRKRKAMTQGFHDSWVIVKIDLRQKRGQRLAEDQSMGLEVGGEELALGAMASLLSVVGPTLLGQPAFDALLASFPHAVKEKTPEALNTLVAAARATKWRELPEALGPLVQYAAPECLSAIATAGVNTDAALVVLQSLINRMEAMADCPYRVEHDQSKNLLTYHELLQRFIDHDQTIEFRQSDIATIKFPLKLAAVTQVDSKTSPAVQLADVMIGAAIEAVSTLAGLRSGGPDPEAVLSQYADHQFIHMIPSIDFKEQRRFRQGT